MKLNYRFSNLLGTVYKQGNLTFSADGNTVISPVGNKVTLYDLKNHLSETLPFESILNIAVVALSPAGTHLFLINDGGEAYYVSLISKTILHRHRFHRRIKAVRFSPNARKIAVCRDSDVQILRAPGVFAYKYNPFVLEDTYKISNDETSCLDWSDDSNLFAVGSIDCQIRVCAGRKIKNLYTTTLGGHKGPIIGCFFESDSFDLFTIDKKLVLNRWECTIEADKLISGDCNKETAQSGQVDMISYRKVARHFFSDAVPGLVQLTATSYHKKNRLLVTGYSNGAFVLHEMPDFNLIHSLSANDQSVRSVSINASGDWLALAFGSSVNSEGSLIVWEWQSETYVLKQQGHGRMPTTVAYSPDGALLATGADDGRVKIWSVRTGFCQVTFSEHTACVTAVVWTQGGKAVLSASLDGSVRACDLLRYRNFRTLVCPRPTQLICLAVDPAGEVVVAGARDIFDLFVWSLQNGRLLEVLSGHTGPVSSVAFNPAHSIVASVSWDRTLRIWDIFSCDVSAETIALSDDGLDVRFAPDGQTVAVVTLDCQIVWFNWKEATQVGAVEGKLHLESARGNRDVISGDKSTAAKSLSTIDYSADGQLILAGGQSKFVCIYHVDEQVLVKKLQITHNLSLDAVASDIDRRKYTEFGNMALIDASDSEDEADGRSRVKLAGVRDCDLGERAMRPEIRVTCVRFSPAGRSFAASTTEGLLLYSLDEAINFDPFSLDVDTTPEAVLTSLASGDHGSALAMALRLNQVELIARTVEAIPIEHVRLLCRSLAFAYVEKLLEWLVSSLESTKHIEFYLEWAKWLVFEHGARLKLNGTENVAVLTGLQDVVSRKRRILANLCDQNKYGLNYILSTIS